MALTLIQLDLSDVSDNVWVSKKFEKEIKNLRLIMNIFNPDGKREYSCSISSNRPHVNFLHNVTDLIDFVAVASETATIVTMDEINGPAAPKKTNFPTFQKAVRFLRRL